MPSISQLSLFSIQGRLLRPLFSATLSYFPASSSPPLVGWGWGDTTVLCNILKNLIFSSPFSLRGRLKEVFILLQKLYFDKIKPPQKVKLSYSALPGFWEHKSLSIHKSNGSSHSCPARYAVWSSLMMLGRESEPQLPVSQALPGLNHRYTYNHPVCTPPILFFTLVQYSINYMRYSTLL